MGKKSIGIIVLVGIICLSIGAGGTYLFQQQEITDLKTSHMAEKNYLNERIKSDVEFNRLFFKAMDEYNKGKFNEGFSRAYYVEADNYFEYYNLSDWGEIYYTYSRDYFNLAKDNYEKAIQYLIQAKNYITNNKTMEFIDSFLDLLNITKERVIIDYNMTDYLRLACYYYNLSDWKTGDEKLEASNEYLDELKSILITYNDILAEIDNLLESNFNE